MNPELFFLRYAFPCTDIRLQQGRITQEKYDELRDIAVNKKTVQRSDLEKVFFGAVEELGILAKKKNKVRWDYDIIKEYFYYGHNEIIDSGKGVYKNWPASLKEMSKVYKAKVIDKKLGKFLVVEYSNGKEIKKRNVLNEFVPDAGIDDYVMIHYAYAVEIANDIKL